MNDERQQHEAIEARLRSALSNQAEGFEPSEDSYLRLRREVHETKRGRVGAGTPDVVGHRLAPRLLAAAAAVAVVAAGASWLLRGERVQQLDVTPASSVTTEQAPTSLATTAPDEPVESTTTTDAVRYPMLDEQAITGPRRLEPAESVDAFLGLVRLAGVDVDVGGAKASLEIDGVWIGTAGIAEVELYDGTGTGFTVEEVHNETVVTVDSLDAGAVVDGSVLEVSGMAGDDVAEVGFALFSNLDGIVLARGSGDVVAGGRYETQLGLVGTESGWLLVSARDADGVLLGVVAKPLQWSAPDPNSYTVSLIAPDDADGGLNVRELPGVDEGEVLVTLPAGTTGIRRRGTVPAFVDGTIWWAVEASAPDGRILEGWVAARHLVLVAAPDPAVVEELARLVVEAPPDEWPWASTVVFGRPTALSPVADAVVLLGDQSEFVGWFEPAITWAVEAPVLSAETDAELSDWWFPGLTPLTFAGTGSTRTTLYLEPSAEGLRIAGVVGWDA